jgi:hypothetical protein
MKFYFNNDLPLVLVPSGYIMIGKNPLFDYTNSTLSLIFDKVYSLESNFL